MKRVYNWYERLSDYLADVHRMPFEYGVHDCILFPAGAVTAVTDVDLAKPFRGKYHDLRSGIKLLHDAGYMNQFAYIEENFSEIPVAMAQPGDIGLVNVSDDGQMLSGCVFGGEMIYVLGENGMAALDRMKAVKAYKVG